MKQCPNKDCGKPGEGNFCSNCGMKLNPILKQCSVYLDEQSRCQEMIEVTEDCCMSCKEKIAKRIEEIKDELSCSASTQVKSSLQELNLKETDDVVAHTSSSNSADRGSDVVDEVAANERDQANIINLIERLPKLPGRSEDELNTIKEIAQDGLSKLREYVEISNNRWMKMPLHIGVTGMSGAGKSTFINTVRGLRHGQDGHAPTGPRQTTFRLCSYAHPQNPNLIFWDMPGVGTRSFPTETYLEDVKFDRYDFFLILSEKRFRDRDGWLAQEIEKSGRSFFFIRTHVDVDVLNKDNDFPPNVSKTDVLNVIRNDCVKELGNANIKDQNKKIFLIDSHRQDLYDYDELMNLIIKTGLPNEMKREALVLSLTAITEGVILEKKRILERRIWKVALASAAGGAVPVPGLGASIDISLILNEFKEYRRQFGLEDEDLQRCSRSQSAKDILVRYGRNIAQIVLQVAIDETLENAFKLGLPVFGSFISGTISYTFTVVQLRKLLNEVVKDAQKLQKETIDQLSTSSDV